jgi:hypothetical protein
MARHRELYRLATEHLDLTRSPDFEPVKDWIEGNGVTAGEQWLLGFGLGSMANAWQASSCLFRTSSRLRNPDSRKILRRINLRGH